MAHVFLVRVRCVRELADDRRQRQRRRRPARCGGVGGVGGGVGVGVGGGDGRSKRRCTVFSGETDGAIAGAGASEQQMPGAGSGSLTVARTSRGFFFMSICVSRNAIGSKASFGSPAGGVVANGR